MVSIECCRETADMGSCMSRSIAITQSDTPELAVIWDKVGLDHNGRDLKGGHSVWFLRGEERIVPASEWPQFLKEQEKLMAARTKKAKNGGERSSDSE